MKMLLITSRIGTTLVQMSSQSKTLLLQESQLTVEWTKDEVIGAAVLDSSSHPFAKMVDIDTEWQLVATTVYGMVFRIVWSDGTEALSGKWAASSISQSMWE